MNQDEFKAIKSDKDGLATYEFLVNNLDSLNVEQLTELVDNLDRIDVTGQYLTSAVRYLKAMDSIKFVTVIHRMVALVIARDREHRYIGDLIVCLYGIDYASHLDEYCNDSNFRRLYKRLHPSGAI